MTRKPDRDECEHGSLRRKCQICQLKEEILELTNTIRWAQRQLVEHGCGTDPNSDLAMARIGQRLKEVLSEYP